MTFIRSRYTKSCTQLGYGTSDSWDSQVTGTDWAGSEVVALVGSGAGIIDAGGAHVTAGTTGLSIVDGTVQEVVMDPNITTGTRKFLTDLDVAFIRDIGFANASASAVPEPTAFAFLFCILGFAGLRCRRRIANFV